jgi:hypothetical protein
MTGTAVYRLASEVFGSQGRMGASDPGAEDAMQRVKAQVAT